MLDYRTADWVTEDRWRLQRRTLRHMLTLMRADGVPVVYRATYFRDLMEDLEEHGSATRGTGAVVNDDLNPNSTTI